ncbi:MAG: hypothetical protein FJZ58_04445 [Chlamydiae bacterium]|nr:hypothetical protein [Chlamydiota bacterium]
MDIEDSSQQKIRQKAILQLIQDHAVSDQKQLVDLLLQQYDLETNQAAVSRDLRKMGIVKKPIQGALLYEAPTSDIQKEILRLALLDIAHNECIIVIKTRPALADFVGDYLDGQTELGILGCVSGENTVLVTPKSTQHIEQTYKLICQALYLKKE